MVIHFQLSSILPVSSWISLAALILKNPPVLHTAHLCGSTFFFSKYCCVCYWFQLKDTIHTRRNQRSKVIDGNCLILSWVHLQAFLRRNDFWRDKRDNDQDNDAIVWKAKKKLKSKFFLINFFEAYNKIYSYKTRVRYHRIPVRMAIIRKATNNWSSCRGSVVNKPD